MMETMGKRCGAGSESEQSQAAELSSVRLREAVQGWASIYMHGPCSTLALPKLRLSVLREEAITKNSELANK